MTAAVATDRDCSSDNCNNGNDSSGKDSGGDDGGCGDNNDDSDGGSGSDGNSNSGTTAVTAMARGTDNNFHHSTSLLPGDFLNPQKEYARKAVFFRSSVSSSVLYIRTLYLRALQYIAK